MFNIGWIERVFEPTIRAAKKAGIDPKVRDRLLIWLRDSKKRRHLIAEFDAFMSECEGDEWAEWIDGT